MTVKAHYDGKVFVPDEEVDLPKDQQVLLEIQGTTGEAEQKPLTAGELATGEWVGAWADRTDITDSTEFINEIRRRIDRREL
jgi:hypothetical protein